MERGTDASRMRFSYGLLRLSGQMVGIVPTFIVDAPVSMGMPPNIAAGLRFLQGLFPGLMRVRSLFVGSPTSVRGTVGLLPGIELAAALAGITEALERRAKATGARIIAWKGFPAPLPGTPYERLSRSLGFEPIDDFPETRLRVPCSWEAYLRSLNAKRRYALRKKLENSRKAAQLESFVVRSPDAATLAEIHALYLQTHRRVKNDFMLLTPEFFARMARTDAAHFVLLREVQTSSLVAFMLCFVVGSRAVNRFTGLEYLVARPWNLHFRLWEAALQFMISVGATEVYSGQTTYRFKVDTGHELVPMTIYTKHRNPLIHRFFLPIVRKTMRKSVWTEL